MAFGQGMATGAGIGAMFGPLGAGIGAALGGIGQSLGLFGGKERPPGTLSTDHILRLLREGKKPEEIAGLGPAAFMRPGRATRRLEKAGLSMEDIMMLRDGPMGGAGGGGNVGGGPAGMAAFQALLPALMAQPAAFSNPAAASWLASLFPKAGPAPTSPSPQFPMPFEGQPTGNRGTAKIGLRGPMPDPFVGLRRLAGPFGNGGAGIIPFNMPRIGKRGSF